MDDTKGTPGFVSGSRGGELGRWAVDGVGASLDDSSAFAVGTVTFTGVEIRLPSPRPSRRRIVERVSFCVMGMFRIDCRSEARWGASSTGNRSGRTCHQVILS
jgi:hypothetical protein